jgi:cytochrome c553
MSKTPAMNAMPRLFARVSAGVVILAVLAVLAVFVLYAASEYLLRKTYDVALVPVIVPADAESIAEGRRLATIRGCNDGCHGKGVSGSEFWNEPWVARLVAPDLTRIAASQSDAELARVIRHGVRKDGRSTFGMPSPMFYHLTDTDLGRIIAFLRSLPVGSGPDTVTHFGPLGRLELLRHPEFAYAEEIARDAPWLAGEELAGESAKGHYLAMTSCPECHGMNFKGAPDGSAPDLAVVGSYSAADFARLMREGIAVGGRELPMMSDIARVRFSQFQDDEVQALYDFLSARARDPRTHE